MVHSHEVVHVTPSCILGLIEGLTMIHMIQLSLMQNMSFANVLQGGIYVFIIVTWQNRSRYLVYKYISS